ncbi:hypothetical protein [Methylobacterium sp. NEAU K]|uniref:hypothetical protein n=1 Tax=Methylobacterium sp. NEAU K TaxID=3064946 RepID=UPI002733230D|nr:hypothetical protein [Methylobacterium sp. NEAU K]MDP4006617.1 hypothetical protein [Methylobacterium sp. NEAU K]
MSEKEGMAFIEEIAAALRLIATPGIKPKALRAAIRERYPEASKKEIVRAAFYAVTDAYPMGQEALSDLHNFALSERGGDEDADASPKVGQRKKKKRTFKVAGRPAIH